MALTNCYVTLDEIQDRIVINDTADDAGLEGAITSACRAIDVWCAQVFYDAGSASEKTFRPTDPYCVEVPPFSTTTGLIVKTDTGDNGGFATTWASTDYELDTYGGDYGLMFGTVPITIFGLSGRIRTRRATFGVRR